MAAVTVDGMIWQPQEDGLREICNLLEQQISPNSDQHRIYQQLNHYTQFPDINNYLVFIFARAEVRNESLKYWFDSIRFTLIFVIDGELFNFIVRWLIEMWSLFVLIDFSSSSVSSVGIYIFSVLSFFNVVTTVENVPRCFIWGKALRITLN